MSDIEIISRYTLELLYQQRRVFLSRFSLLSLVLRGDKYKYFHPYIRARLVYAGFFSATSSSLTLSCIQHIWRREELPDRNEVRLKTKNKTVEEARERKKSRSRSRLTRQEHKFHCKTSIQARAARRGMKVEQNRVYFKRSGWAKCRMLWTHLYTHLQCCRVENYEAEK